MEKRKKEREELPDYTVANMDLEGMPWNSRRLWQLMPGDPARRRRAGRSMGGRALYGADREVSPAKTAGDAAEGVNAQAEEGCNGLSARETWSLAWQALKAGLLVGGIFAAGGLIFLLFCVFVWFR